MPDEVLTAPEPEVPQVVRSRGLAQWSPEKKRQITLAAATLMVRASSEDDIFHQHEREANQDHREASRHSARGYSRRRIPPPRSQEE